MVQYDEENKRSRIIIRTSIIGIAANVLLSLFKGTIGILSNSIAILLDAVNNLSDALSSVITIVGTKLAGREPDRKHPFGYGRIEYLSALVSFIALVLPIAILLEIIFDKYNKKNYKDNKTDWYYNNEEHDRKYDERADKNNYRIL